MTTTTAPSNTILRATTGKYTDRNGRVHSVALAGCQYRAKYDGYCLPRGDGDVFIITPDTLDVAWARILANAWDNAAAGRFMRATAELRRIQSLDGRTRTPHLAAINATRQHADNACELIEACADAWKANAPHLSIIELPERADRETAAHESAHILSAYVLGEHIIAATIEPHNNTAGMVQHRTPPGCAPLTAEQSAVINIAGLAAEHKLSKPSETLSAVAFGSDFASIDRQGLTEAQITSATAEAQRIIKTHHTSFVQLTAALLSFGQLSATDVESIIKAHDAPAVAAHNAAIAARGGSKHHKAKRKLRHPLPTLSEGQRAIVARTRAAVTHDHPNPLGRLLEVARGNAELTTFVGDVASALNDRGADAAAELLQMAIDASNTPTTKGLRP